MFPKLEEMNLNNNALTAFPEFAHQRTLVKINVASNYIKEIPFFLV
jgi:hypothetical protein